MQCQPYEFEPEQVGCQEMTVGTWGRWQRLQDLASLTLQPVRMEALMGCRSEEYRVEASRLEQQTEVATDVAQGGATIARKRRWDGAMRNHIAVRCV